ncbi:hypothetical protein L195_g015896, partial [Trifolium pratense]
MAKILKARWRTGSGSSIRVMNEPWLRGEEGRWVKAPQNQEDMVRSILGDSNKEAKKNG